MTKMVYLVLALAATGSAVVAQQPVAKAVREVGVSRADYDSLAAREFAAIDGTRDGKLTPAEIEQYRQKRMEERARQVNAARFVQLDKDKNGYLSQQEFAALIGPLPRVNSGPMMTTYDKNKDGVLTLEEYQAGSLGDFDRRDTNKDGTLTPAEARSRNPAR